MALGATHRLKGSIRLETRWMKLFSDAAWKSETGVLPLSLLHYSPFRWNINATNKAKVRKRRTLLWSRTREAESWFQEKASAKAALIWCEVSRRTRWTSQVGLVDFLIHVGWNFFLSSAQNQYVKAKKTNRYKNKVLLVLCRKTEV